jgi:hypothetical protein
MCVPINKVTLKVNADHNNNSEWQKEFEQILPYFFVLKEPGKEIEIIQVSNDHGEDHLDRNKCYQCLPIKVFSFAASVTDRKQKERQVHKPERQVKKENPVTLDV